MTLKGHEKFGGKLTFGFQFSPGKIVQFCSSQQEGRNFRFYGIVLPERSIGSIKNCGRSFTM